MPYSTVDRFVHPDVVKIEEIIREIYSVPPEPTVPEDAEGESTDGEAADENAAEEGE
jgi:hypothetical protein